MKSQIEMKEQYINKFKSYLKSSCVHNGIKPARFMSIMQTHLNIINFKEIDNKDFIDLRNPLIVVLGDSVSGGHFEMIDIEKMEIAHDLQDSYVEKFKHLLHKKYPLTTPSIINSSLAGDNIQNMAKRLTRDVINYQPDLVIINATLNWSINRGSLAKYKFYLEHVIERIKRETTSDIVLLTPNDAIVTSRDTHLNQRVNIARKAAENYQITLIDIHKMWTDVLENNDVKETLSNQENHPTPLGHTFMAEAIMQILYEEE